MSQDELIDDERPPDATEWFGGANRREFLQLMGASLVMAGAAGCSRSPVGDVVPYVHPPEVMVPGEPLYYASAFVLDGFAAGVLVESHAGRPTKIEGNPEHPASLGATDAFTQAATWGLYDPQRSQSVLRKSEHADSTFRRAETGAENDAEADAFAQRSWPEFRAELRRRLGFLQNSGGRGLRILTRSVTSPTLSAQLDALLRNYPQAGWHQWSPINRDRILAGTRRAFGRPLHPRYDLSKADVILALDADYLSQGPGRLAYARAWADKRAVRSGDPAMSRFYVVEPVMTSTGSKADHRLAMNPRRMEGFLRELARSLGVPGVSSETGEFSDFEPTPRETSWLDALAADLREHRARSAVIPGDAQSAEVHALAHAVNAHLENVGATVEFSEPVLARPDSQLASIRQLAADIRAGEVDTLLILDGNPAYDAPADLEFAELIEKVEMSAHLSLYVDETSRRCTWHVPALHFLETWSDARAFDGTVTILQPLIEPLYDGHSSHEVLDAVNDAERDSFAIVKEYWLERIGAPDFPRIWRESLLDGMVSGTMLKPVSVALRPDFDQKPVGGVLQNPARNPTKNQAKNQAANAGNLTVIFAADPSVWDGRFAKNAMLQELPKPMSTLTWDNAAMLSLATARALGVENEDVVRIEYRGRSVEAPVWIAPGHANDCVTLRLGYGHEAGDLLSTGVGFNAYRLRTSEALWFDGGLSVQKTAKTYPLAMTQLHHRMHDQPIVEHATLAEFVRRAAASAAGAELEEAHVGQSLYPEYEYDDYAWAMSIDLTRCIACKACVAACQAENNIPIVGKKQVLVAREMHWIRVDTYYEGPPESPKAFHQPVPCMHCEKAPCELVCPVEATTHSSEGINEMTYNRCVGTRYCSNNCPYKVRRFNFLDYASDDVDDLEAVLDLKYNPDVTVRSRGVMEKCTYCIQRINAARVNAQLEGRRIRDDDFQTACEQVCPTRTIVFGDKNNPDARVTRIKQQPHDYALLAHLNTRPRTTYLGAITNPNPALEE
jgi:molybdopterin-containing oxidoreductase family iron-sulfur binding subunit